MRAVVVDQLPPCDWPSCGTGAVYDAPLTREARKYLQDRQLPDGAWANLCGLHFSQYGVQTSVNTHFVTRAHNAKMRGHQLRRGRSRG